MSMLDEILGLGYSGYALINNQPILLMPSSAAEEDNLIVSDAPFSTSAITGNGVMPARDRRSLSINLSTLVTKDSAHFIKTLTYGPWRNDVNIDFALPVAMKIILSEQEGYEAQAYVDSVSVSCGVDELITFSIQATAWVWVDKFSTQPTPRESRVLMPLVENHKPVPHWKGVLTSNCIGSETKPISWTAEFANNWKYEQLLEAWSFAPNPGHITVGDLTSTVKLKWLARRNDRPRESGNAVIRMGDAAPVLPILQINYPILYRDSSRDATGTGDPNKVVEWEASYASYGLLPF